MSDPPVVELQVIVSYPMGALGMELKPSSRAVCTLNMQLLLLPPRSAFDKKAPHGMKITERGEEISVQIP